MAPPASPPASPAPGPTNYGYRASRACWARTGAAGDPHADVRAVRCENGGDRTPLLAAAGGAGPPELTIFLGPGEHTAAAMSATLRRHAVLSRATGAADVADDEGEVVEAGLHG